jgi:hypothetical protein
MRKIAVVVLILASTWASPVFANVTQTITIDENNPTESLPFPVVGGVIQIFEETPSAQISDFVAFYSPVPGSTQSSILYCSASTVSDGKDSFADVVPLSACTPGLGEVILVEPAEGLNQTIVYTPTASQPGFADPVTYIINGDAATLPEPGSLLLLGSGFCALVGRIRRR